MYWCLRLEKPREPTDLHSPPRWAGASCGLCILLVTPVSGRLSLNRSKVASCNSRLVFCHLNNPRVKSMSFLEFLAKIPARPLIGPFSEPITMLRSLLGQAWVLGSFPPPAPNLWEKVAAKAPHPGAHQRLDHLTLFSSLQSKVCGIEK